MSDELLDMAAYVVLGMTAFFMVFPAITSMLSGELSYKKCFIMGLYMFASIACLFIVGGSIIWAAIRVF